MVPCHFWELGFGRNARFSPADDALAVFASFVAARGAGPAREALVELARYVAAMAAASRYCRLEAPQTERVLDRFASIWGIVSGLTAGWG